MKKLIRDPQFLTVLLVLLMAITSFVQQQQQEEDTRRPQKAIPQSCLGPEQTPVSWNVTSETEYRVEEYKDADILLRGNQILGFAFSEKVNFKSKTMTVRYKTIKKDCAVYKKIQEALNAQ